MAIPQALIKDLEGEVNVTRNGEMVTVKVGDFLLPGDEVVTSATGRLALEFAGTEGQIPASGVMTANGKLILGEQPGPNGQQMVVMEEVECFEFTTELAENSAATEAGAVSGLFGAGLLGLGGASAVGAGAVAAGAFLSTDSEGSGSDPNAPIAGSPGSGLPGVSPGEFSSVDSPQSLQEFVKENLTQQNLEQSIIQPIQNAAQASQDNPESTPENIAVATEQIALAGIDNVSDALVATTGEESPQAELVQQLLEAVNQTPAGEPLTPLTSPLADAANTDLSFETIATALPNIELAQGGLVSDAVDLVTDIAQPLSQEIEPLDHLTTGLQTVAPQIDTALNNLLSQITTQAPSLDILPELGSAKSLESALPSDSELTQLISGILGGPDTLQSALEGSSGCAVNEISETDLLSTVSNGISSGADSLGEQLGGLSFDALKGQC